MHWGENLKASMDMCKKACMEDGTVPEQTRRSLLLPGRTIQRAINRAGRTGQWYLARYQQHSILAGLADGRIHFISSKKLWGSVILRFSRCLKITTK